MKVPTVGIFGNRGHFSCDHYLRKTTRVDVGVCVMAFKAFRIRPFLHLCAFIVVAFLGKIGKSQETIAIDSCRQAGFDPSELSCKTCDVLPERILSKCKTCCQSFRSVEKLTQRYEAAVLLQLELPQYFVQEIDELQDDAKDIQKQKGTDRFQVKALSMGSINTRSSMILWFDEIPNYNADVQELFDKSVENTSLDGWKRDDARDMLYALLLDKGV